MYIKSLNEDERGAKVMSSSDLQPAIIYFLVACAITVFVFMGEVRIKKTISHSKKLNMTHKIKLINLLCILFLLFLLTIINQQLMDKIIAKNHLFSKKSLIHYLFLIFLLILAVGLHGTADSRNPICKLMGKEVTLAYKEGQTHIEEGFKLFHGEGVKHNNRTLFYETMTSHSWNLLFDYIQTLGLAHLDKIVICLRRYFG